MRYLLTIVFLSTCAANAQEPLYDKVFFSNSRMEHSYFYSEASYKGASWIRNVQKKLPVNSSMSFTPGNSLELNYVSAATGEWQAKILFHPSRGMDFFTAPSSLTMRLMVRSETRVAELPQIGVGNRKDSAFKFIPLQPFVPSIQKDRWLTVQVPLEQFQFDTDKIDVIVFKQHAANGKEHVLLIDQLELLPEKLPSSTSKPVIGTAKGYEKHVDITWKPVSDTAIKYIKVYRSADGGKFYPVGIQSPFISRYTDYVDTTGKKYFYRITLLDKNYKESAPSAVASASTRSMTEEQLLDMVQEAHFRYYWEGAEKTSGLALENIHGRKNMIATGASGFGMMALIAGTERKFITRNALVERFEKITAFLEKADKFHGAFPHFLDGPSGKVEAFFGPKDNGADLVETSFLAQGLLAAKQYFNPSDAREKKIIDKIDNLWRNIEWNWFRKEEGSKYLYWHWSPDQEWVINHKLIGWNETMITYFMAIASPTHAVPASFYYSGWASQDTIAQQYRSGWGQTNEGSAYTNGNVYFGIPLKVGVSNGGPLFFIHYSYLGLDPHHLRDAYTDYFSNNRNIALINHRYCIENPENHKGYGADAWGLTASDGLWNYQADEPVPHQDHGKITPTGALASFPYTPAESMTALKNYYRNYGKFAWGEYGFRDAFNLDENWCSEIFMGLNQGPIAVMIENHRSGLLWKLFMRNPEVRKAAAAIAEEKP